MTTEKFIIAQIKRHFADSRRDEECKTIMQLVKIESDSTLAELPSRQEEDAFILASLKRWLVKRAKGFGNKYDFESHNYAEILVEVCKIECDAIIGEDTETVTEEPNVQTD